MLFSFMGKVLFFVICSRWVWSLILSDFQWECSSCRRQHLNKEWKVVWEIRIESFSLCGWWSVKVELKPTPKQGLCLSTAKKVERWIQGAAIHGLSVWITWWLEQNYFFLLPCPLSSAQPSMQDWTLSFWAELTVCHRIARLGSIWFSWLMHFLVGSVKNHCACVSSGNIWCERS